MVGSHALRELEELLQPGAVVPVFQPIVRINDHRIIGYEALARFPSAAVERSPDRWFALADEHDLRLELELACWRAIAAAGPVPDDGLLFVNTSPATLVDRRLEVARQDLPERLVVELTEQDAVADYEVLRDRLQSWSNRGVRLAIDDTGAGHSSLRHVLQLSPDFLKVDRSIISGLDHDRNRRALVWSLAAFAREVGATVIAEGVETAGELEVLRSAGVALAQGWLFGRPAAPWADIDALGEPPESPPRSIPVAPGPWNDDQRLDVALAAATDEVELATAVCDHLFRAASLMPSVYIERNGLLRCAAQRGYWQILDGIPLDTGVLATAIRESRRIVRNDVQVEAEFLEAVPGIVAEVAIPLVVDGIVVGGLNAESLVPLDEDTIRLVDECATMLAERLAEVSVDRSESAMHRLARSMKRLAGLTTVSDVRRAAVEMALEVTQMESAMLVQRVGTLDVVAAIGPMDEVMRSIPDDDIAQLAATVARVSSCYTAGDPTGRPVAGAESLRAAGATEVAVVPLVSLGRRIGFLLTAGTSNLQLSSDRIEPLELLATETARSLDLAATIAELRHRAASDPLTGLGNHSTFHEALASCRPGTAVALFDLDRFKAVNDAHGHLAGDRLLRDVGKVLSTAIAPYGRAFRIGGDEFASVLGATSLADAQSVIDDVAVALDRLLAQHGASVSIGLTMVEWGEAPNDTVDRADRLLYASKRSECGSVHAA